MTRNVQSPAAAATVVEELLVAYSSDMPSLRRFVRRLVGSASEAEEIVQDAFCRVLQMSRRMAVHAVRPYLFRTAHNLALKHLRRTARFLDAPAQDSDEPSLISEQPTLEQHASAREEFSTLIDALETLPPQCRRVLILRKVYDLSQKEIAEQLNISTSTVEKHVIKGLLRCREYVRARGLEPGREHNPRRHG